MTPFGVPLTWVAVLLLAWGGAAYWAGDHNRNNAWLAKEAAAAQQAQLAYVAEVQRGQAAAQQSIDEQQKLQKSYQLLEGKFNELVQHGPLVVYKPVASGAQPVAGLAPGQRPADAGLGGAGADGDISLSLGAVWMWNSALAGTDSAAGACAAADTASAACAADAGLGLEDAWQNHAANAESCALDRLRFQALIDFVGQTRPPPPERAHAD